MIDLDGTDDPLDEDRKKFAFPVPGSNDALRYLESDPDPKYEGYLVKVISFDDATVDFRGINLSTGSVSETTRTVEFLDMETVWMPGPSSNLSNWDATNCCMILFLSDAYTSGKSDLQAAKGGGGKWPKGSGLAIMRLHEKIQHLEQKVNKAKPDVHSLMAKLSDHDKQQFMEKLSDFLR